MNDNSILIRYSEIALKGGKRSWFEKLLINNIKEKLGNNLKDIKKYPGRIVLFPRNIDKAINDLQYIFGIKSYSPSYYTTFEDLEDLVNKAFIYFKKKVEGKKFKVECVRVGEHKFSSYDVKKEVGAILSEVGVVDIKNPDVIAFIEIRNKDVYFYTDIIEGYGGLPVGSEAKVISLISGGFDSPIAAWYVMRRGAKVDHMHCWISDEQSLNSLLLLIKELTKWSVGYKPKIYIYDCRELLFEILNKVKEDVQLIVFRRILYYLGEQLAKKIGAKALITGESLGQKSSQTMENLYSAQYGINIPIIRPLIGFDKDDIVKLSRKLNLYNFSLKVGEPCAILSQHPKPKSNPGEINREFLKIQDKLNSLPLQIIDTQDIDVVIKEIRLSKNHKFEFDENSKIITIGNINIPNAYIRIKNLKEIKDIIKRLDNKYKYIIVCKTGNTAKLIADILKDKNIKAVGLSKKEFKDLFSNQTS